MSQDAEVTVYGLYHERTYRVPVADPTQPGVAVDKAKEQFHQEFSGVEGTVKKIGVKIVPSKTVKTGDGVDARVIRAADQ